MSDEVMISAASDKKWIQKAIKRPGDFTRKARRAGMSVRQYARKVLRKNSRADTRTKRQAVLALRFIKGI